MVHTLRDFTAERKQRETLVPEESRRFGLAGMTLVRSASYPAAILVRSVEAEKTDDYKTIFECVGMMLEEESRTRYQAAVDNGTVTVDEIIELSQWLAEQGAQRPTGPSRPSSAGSVTALTGTPSTEGYFSTVAPVSPASTSEGSAT